MHKILIRVFKICLRSLWTSKFVSSIKFSISFLTDIEHKNENLRFCYTSNSIKYLIDQSINNYLL